MIALGRLGHVDDVAKAITYLATDDSSFITGIELFVDGGLAQV
jgi:NAD(P)-dependent dehydrogenase (short-subunit alcohol dehydrogenase family)